MKKTLVLIAALLIGYAIFNSTNNPTRPNVTSANFEQGIKTPESIVANQFSSQQSGQQVSGQGVVVRILPDDNDGSRHQKFIIRLPSGQTILIAHNIDLAPKIGSLQEGDTVEFFGQYEWNEKGGLVHWTHHDPNGSHTAGWLQHQGQKYQ
ncbi:MAG: DUF3465 domain-containing protein [Gallionella sp.]|nr:DUF3465 domain-containing protein [Gallionella sp.]